MTSSRTVTSCAAWIPCPPSSAPTICSRASRRLMPERARSVAAVAIVLFTLVATAAPAWGQSPPNRDDRCAPLWVKPVPAAGEGEVVLPVIVHYMKSTGQNHRGNDIAKKFTQASLRQYFDQGQFINGTVWGQAKIRLFLHRIETCRYAP